MKTLFTALALLAFGASSASAAPTLSSEQQREAKKRQFIEMIKAYNNAVKLGKIGKSCRYKGKKLWGKVKVVKSFPDFKVKIVSSFPDLKVKRVSSFPSSCGKWKFVKSFPDFKIKYVSSFPDFKIKFVSSFPGVR